MNYNHPHLGKRSAEGDERHGTGVQAAEQREVLRRTADRQRFTDKARRQAQSNVTSLREAIVDKGIPVLATSSTCTFTLRDEYPHLLDVDNTGPARAHRAGDTLPVAQAR